MYDVQTQIRELTSELYAEAAAQMGYNGVAPAPVAPDAPRPATPDHKSLMAPPTPISLPKDTRGVLRHLPREPRHIRRNLLGEPERRIHKRFHRGFGIAPPPEDPLPASPPVAPEAPFPATLQESGAPADTPMQIEFREFIEEASSGTPEERIAVQAITEATMFSQLFAMMWNMHNISRQMPTSVSEFSLVPETYQPSGTYRGDRRTILDCDEPDARIFGQPSIPEFWFNRDPAGTVIWMPNHDCKISIQLRDSSELTFDTPETTPPPVAPDAPFPVSRPRPTTRQFMEQAIQAVFEYNSRTFPVNVLTGRMSLIHRELCPAIPRPLMLAYCSTYDTQDATAVGAWHGSLPRKRSGALCFMPSSQLVQTRQITFVDIIEARLKARRDQRNGRLAKAISAAPAAPPASMPASSLTQIRQFVFVDITGAHLEAIIARQNQIEGRLARMVSAAPAAPPAPMPKSDGAGH